MTVDREGVKAVAICAVMLRSQLFQAILRPRGLCLIPFPRTRGTQRVDAVFYKRCGGIYCWHLQNSCQSPGTRGIFVKQFCSPQRICHSNPPGAAPWTFLVRQPSRCHCRFSPVTWSQQPSHCWIYSLTVHAIINIIRKGNQKQLNIGRTKIITEPLHGAGSYFGDRQSRSFSTKYPYTAAFQRFITVCTTGATT